MLAGRRGDWRVEHTATRDSGVMVVIVSYRQPGSVRRYSAYRRHGDGWWAVDGGWVSTFAALRDAEHARATLALGPGHPLTALLTTAADLAHDAERAGVGA